MILDPNGAQIQCFDTAGWPMASICWRLQAVSSVFSMKMNVFGRFRSIFGTLYPLESTLEA